jgi:hypothetical protein
VLFAADRHASLFHGSCDTELLVRQLLLAAGAADTAVVVHRGLGHHLMERVTTSATGCRRALLLMHAACSANDLHFRILYFDVASLQFWP